MMVSWLQLVSRHVIEVQEISFKKFGTELQRGWPPADSSWQCYYMLGTTTKLSVLFQSSGVVLLRLKEIFLGLGVTVTEINIKKVQKQDLKNIENVEGCRDGMPKSMQTR